MRTVALAMTAPGPGAMSAGSEDRKGWKAESGADQHARTQATKDRVLCADAKLQGREAVAALRTIKAACCDLPS